ncbi:hypothetical protein E3J74_08435 [Candidatus Bathyarchaeota archaeon]|nr:MAG: hypothetical protein E3J74_08435 [Candidatus Bathyarchaeota archaeon]
MQRYVRNKVKLALAVLIILLAFSGYLIYFFHNKPLTHSRYVANCEYQQQVDYNYVASIKPSMLYENRTKLLPGETAYRSLIKSLNISLTYNFSSNPSPEHVELTYGVSAVLEAEKQWSKEFVLTSEKTQNTPDIKETYELNLTEIEELIKTIEKETDTRASTYYYKIVPKIRLNSSTAVESIIEEYTPTLQIKLAPTILEFTGLSHTKLGSIGNQETYETSWSLAGFTTTIKNMRYFSYALVLLFSGCLMLMVWRTQKIPPPPFMETIKKEYREKIIEAKEPLTKKVEKATIKVESVEDLMKVSEETFKPIIHETSTMKKRKVKRHTLYVLDADIKYELVMEEPIESTR